MAVVVVGDIDGEEQDHVLSTIASTFSPMTNTGSPTFGAPELPVVALPRHPKDLVLVLEDAELTQTSVSVEFFERLTVANTLSHLRGDVIKRLCE